MTHGASSQIFIVLEVTFKAQFVPCTFKRCQMLLITGFTVVAGFAPLNFLTCNIVNFFTVISFGVMATITFQPLVGMMGQVCWSGDFLFVNC